MIRSALEWFVLSRRHSTSGAGRRAAACDPLHSCCDGVAAQNPPAQTVWVVDFYSNVAIHCGKCSDDAPPCWNVPAWQRYWDGSVHRNSVRIIGQNDVTITSGCFIDDVTITPLYLFETASDRLGWTVCFSFIWGCTKFRNANEQRYFSIVNINRDWTHVCDSILFNFNGRKILRSRE